MYTTTVVAWGIPVDVCRSIAHVEVYVEHSLATDAFIECVQHGGKRNAAIGKLPAELITMIMEMASHCIETRCIQWDEILMCCTNNCVWLSPNIDRYILPIDWLVRSHKEECREEHGNTRRRILEVVGDRLALDGSDKGTFALYNKVLFQNLGLQMHFTVGIDDRDPDGNIEILAHLIRPSESQHAMNYKTSYCLLTMVVDPHTLQQSQDGLRTLFGTAMRVLDLEAQCSDYHALPKMPTITITEDPLDEDSKTIDEVRLALDKGEWPKLLVLAQTQSGGWIE